MCMRYYSQGVINVFAVCAVEILPYYHLTMGTRAFLSLQSLLRKKKAVCLACGRCLETDEAFAVVTHVHTRS